MKQCARILVVVLAVFLVCLALPAEDKPMQKESKQAKPGIKPPKDADVKFEVTITADQRKQVIESNETDNSVGFNCTGRYPAR